MQPVTCKPPARRGLGYLNTNISLILNDLFNYTLRIGNKYFFFTFVLLNYEKRKKEKKIHTSHRNSLLSSSTIAEQISRQLNGVYTDVYNSKQKNIYKLTFVSLNGFDTTYNVIILTFLHLLCVEVRQQD